MKPSVAQVVSAVKRRNRAVASNLLQVQSGDEMSQIIQARNDD